MANFGPAVSPSPIVSNAGEFLLCNHSSPEAALYFANAEYSHHDVAVAAGKVAGYLSSTRAKQGDRVLLVADNSLFWVAAYLGALRRGLVCVPLPTKIASEDLQFIVQSAQPAVAFLRADIATLQKSMFSDLDVVVDKGDGPELSFDRLIAQGAEEKWVAPTSLVEVATLMYTSGSTAKPRGVMVTHGNIIANTQSIIEYLELSSSDRMMAVLPFHYCFGTSLLHTHLRVGGSLVVDHRFMYPEAIVQRMKETECTGFAGVPSHYQILLRRSSLPRTRLPRLRYVQQAGGHLAPALVRELRTALPGTKVFVMYGQTEATARLSYLPPELLEQKPGSIGKAIPGVTLQILTENGREIGPGEVGEIVAEGANIANGYWHDPTETAKCFRDGKLYTGDLATVDEEGFIYVVDRAKDFIKCAGKRIGCRQIEEKLLELDRVLEVAVIGIPDPLLGEAVKVFVVPRDRKDESFDETFRGFCKERLPLDLFPREIVSLRELPKNSSGKVLKQVLKAKSAQA
jgi:long-chain acyl-CoA synthetase